jgi:hypothetical protein
MASIEPFVHGDPNRRSNEDRAGDAKAAAIVATGEKSLVVKVSFR